MGRRSVVSASKSRDIEALCGAKGMRMTEQRRVIARVLGTADDHPDVEELYRRCSAVDDRISISTVYRTVKLFEDAGIIERHDFRRKHMSVGERSCHRHSRCTGRQLQMSKLLCCLIGFALTAALTVEGVAQTGKFPERPVKMLVGFSAGGGTDVVARIVAQKLS